MKILIGTGPTREYLDPVRFISNPSTGKMGYLIAEECIKQGYRVTIVTGPTHLKPPPEAELIKVVTGEQMRREIVTRFRAADVLIMCAAVSDWKPARKAARKIKRKKSWNLRLVPNPDILKETSRIKRPGQKTIGFALETSGLMKNARKKLMDKRLDLIVANTPEFFGEQEKPSNVVFIHKCGHAEKFRKATKKQTARKIVSLLPRI